MYSDINTIILTEHESTWTDNSKPKENSEIFKSINDIKKAFFNFLSEENRELYFCVSISY